MATGTRTTNDGTGNGAYITAVWFQGPAYQNGDQGTLSAGTHNGGALEAGDTVQITNGGGNGSGLAQQVRASVTVYTTSFQNNNNASVSLAANSTGGAQTYTSGQSRTVQTNGSSSSWTIGFGGSTVYDWTARRTTTVPASLTTGGTTYNFPVVNQDYTIAENVASFTATGSYRVVNATDSELTAPTRASTTAGVGIVGVSNAESPPIGLRIRHGRDPGAAQYFDAYIPPFERDTNTSASFASQLVTNLRTNTNFAASNRLDTDHFYYVYQNDTEVFIERTSHGNLSDTDTLVISEYTRYNNVNYSETHFGGNISPNLRVETQGGSGVSPPVMRLAHPREGNILIPITGSVSSSTALATQVASTLSPLLQNNVVIRPAGTALFKLRRTEVGPDSDNNGTLTVDNDASNVLPASYSFEGARFREGVSARNVEPVWEVTTPQGITARVDFDGIGDENGQISLWHIADQIVSQFNEQLDSDAYWVRKDTADTERVLFSQVAPHDQVTFTWGDSEFPLSEARGYSATARYARPVTMSDNAPTSYTYDSDRWNWVLLPGDTGTRVVDTDSDGVWNTTGETSVPTTNTPMFINTPGRISIITGDSENDIYQTYTDMSPAEVATALNARLNQTDEYVVTYASGSSTISAVVSDFDENNDAIILSVTFNEGDSDGSQINWSDNVSVSNRTDGERPWAVNTFNTSRNYILGNTRTQLYAYDIGYAEGNNATGDSEYTMYVERKRLHIAPTKDVEKLAHIELAIETSNADLDSEILNIYVATADYSAADTDLTTVTPYEHRFNSHKADIRDTGRLIHTRLSNKSANDVVISDIGVGIMKRGER